MVICLRPEPEPLYKSHAANKREREREGGREGGRGGREGGREREREREREGEREREPFVRPLRLKSVEMR